MLTELQHRAMLMPAARATHVKPGSWDHFERVIGDSDNATIGLTVNR